jgi:NADH:ubiquinone reductase (H+-translocating)
MDCDDTMKSALGESAHSSPAPEGGRVLILGGGFGGIYAALRLEKLLAWRDGLTVTLVTRDNYFLFTPMLHEVAAAELEPNTIVNPLRKLLRRVKSFVGTIESIDLKARRVIVSHALDGHKHELLYDQLILALGAGINFFNLPGVEGSCLTLKTLGDAVAVRNQLVTALEEANSECAAGERQPLLTFIVAGGGFAGVETLGGINDFVREAIRFYPNLHPDHLRFVLVTPDEVILPELNRKLGIYAQGKLTKRGVEIITGAKVSAITDGIVELTNGETISANTVIWSAGTAPNPLIAMLPVPKHNGRIVVDAYLGVEGWPGLWAVGDCALVSNPRTGGFYPPTAQHALREGNLVARNVDATLYGGGKKTFRYRTLGQLAAIGRRTGVANVLGVNFSGFFAWWLWRTIYLSKLPRLEKKVRVALDWTLDLCFAKDFACVTTRPSGSTPARSAVDVLAQPASQRTSDSASPSAVS